MNDDLHIGSGDTNESVRTVFCRAREPSLEATLSRKPAPIRRVGHEAIDRFVVLDLIARGGMGELYLGWDDRLDRKVAIKLVHPGRHNARAEQRLLREAKLLGQISHPNVVSVFEVGVFEAHVFVAMEFVEGCTLRRWLGDLDAVGAERCRRILECMVAAGRGLAAAHAAGLAHRDFKPENVLVGVDGRVRIVDFGIARLVHEAKTDELAQPPSSSDDDCDGDPLELPTLTEDGMLLGTPRYMAPEQWLGHRSDERSDQFSFCVALYEALFGFAPFEAPSLEALSAAVSSGRMRPMPRRADVPLRVREALLRGLSTAPDDRFADMDALLDALSPDPAARRSRILFASVSTLVALLASAMLLWSRADTDRIALAEALHEELGHELDALAQLERTESEVAALVGADAVAEADAVFGEFAELRDHAGTLALAGGWLHQAARLEQRGESDAAIDAYAAAYLSSSARHRTLALLGVARAFMRTRQWEGLGATLDALEHGFADASQLDPRQRLELRTMRVAELASRRELERAAELLEPLGRADDEDDAAVRAAMLELGRVRRTKHELDGSNLELAELSELDLDGDGVGELLVARQGASSLTILGTASPELAALAQLELPAVRGAARVVADPRTLASELGPLVAVRRGSRHSLYAITRADEQQLHADPLGEYEQVGELPASWAVADLDGDSTRELYLGLESPRKLVGLELERRGLANRWTEPHPATNAASSVIYGLEAGDLDGDGDEELAVLAGEWSAYDLRILAAEPVERGSSPPSLRLVGRRKLGAVQSIALLPAARGPGQWIAVGVADMFPSRRVFPAEALSGAPGLHLLAWDGASVRTLATWELPSPTRIIAGDLDGNGLSDLAVALAGAERECELLLQTHAGEFRRLTLRGLWPVGSVDLDADGDDELLAIDTGGRESGPPVGTLVVLGAGDSRVTPLARGSASEHDSETARALRGWGSDCVDAPPLLGARPSCALALGGRVADSAIGDAIDRVEELARIGLPLRAATRASALARVAEPRLAAFLRVRAAELFAGRGHRLEAADLYTHALAEPDALGRLGPRVRALASDLYARLHRFEAAAELTANAEPLPEPPPRLEFDFEAPLDERWSIDPLAVRRQHGRLELTLGGAEQGVVARRELDWDGGRLELELELDVDTLEWSGEIAVELRPLDAEAGGLLEVGIASWGGGGIYRADFRCVDRGAHEPSSRGWPVPLPRDEVAVDRRHFELSAEAVAGLGVWCVAEGEGLHVEAPVDGELRPGRYELLIRGSTYPWSRAKANVERISIVGARDVGVLRVPVDDRGRLGRELAEGHVDAVLAELDLFPPELLDPRERAGLRFLALDELGRGDEARLALTEALGLDPSDVGGDCRRDPESATLAGLLLRHRPERLGPILRELCRPDDYFALLYEVWATAIHQHPDSDAVERVLITQTTGLERWLPANPSDRLAALILLRARARAWSAQRAHGVARAELERAVELGSRWLATRDGGLEARVMLAAELALARTDLAAELFDRGDEDRAVEVLEVALQTSPTPEVLADMLAIDGRFEVLSRRPLWRKLVDSVRAGGKIERTR